MSPERREARRRWIQRWGTLSGVGLTLVIATMLGLGGGYVLDRWLGSSPWLTLGGLLLGIVAGFVNLFRAVGAANQNGDEPDRERER